MKNILRKSFLLAVATILASSLWAVAPTLSINESTQGSSSFLTSYPTEGITISSTASFSSGAVQLGNTPSGAEAYNAHYIEVLAANNTIDSISYLISGNGSNKSIQAPVFGWETTATSNTANTYSILEPVTVSANSYAAAQWFTYDFHSANVKCLRIYRSTKNISSTNPAYTGGSTALGTGNTIKVYGLKIWLKPAGPVAVTGVSLNKTSTSIEQGGEEQLTATVAPSNAANRNVSWSSNAPTIASVDQTGKVSALSPGTATITVTTEDGNHTATCTVTVTAPPTPIEVTGISLNKSTATVYVGSTETLTVIYTPADANSGKAVAWSSSNESVATVDANGTVTAVAVGQAIITATSTTDASISASCTVTVDVVHPTGVSLNKSSLDMQIGGSETLTATVAPSNASNKSVTWTSSNPAVATVNNGTVSALSAGTTTITVTTVDGNKTTTCSVTVTDGPPVPSTDLTLHVPEKYEASELAGGYNTQLAVSGSREYEVYYINRDKSSNVTIAVSNGDQAGNICDENGTSNNCTTADGWARIRGNGTGGDANATATAEYKTSVRCVKLTGITHMLEMHIQGYDQFSFYGKDNNSDATKNKMFEVYIDDVKQTRSPMSAYGIERFDITSGRHVIRITGSAGNGDNKLCSFSLRVAQEPRTKYIKGNDSNQVVLQTTSIRPITYATKYNNLPGAETRLVWDGPEANGFTLSKTEGDLSDTLQLTGIANCPTGIYKYYVVSYYNGIETSRVPGSFQVSSTIKATSELDITVYQNEDIDDPVTFRYYALSASDVQLTWTGTEPNGISGSGSNGIYTISGRPTTIGTYPYSITVTGGDTTFTGTIKVDELDLGNNPILFLCKDIERSKKDPVYIHLTSSAGGNKNLVRRKARKEGKRSPDQYAAYKWILISEDVDADNKEVLDIVQGAVDLPVFNMKGFTYSGDRLGWGYPDNGTVDTVSGNNCNIYIFRNDHPIFSRFNAKQGDKLTIFEKMKGNGVMPIAISGEKMENTLCLATGYTRDIDHYYVDGELQTAIHEIPARMRGGKKYICMPLAFREENKLTPQGKALIDAIVSYLLDNGSAAPAAPELQINSFSILGVEGDIIQATNTIDMAFDINKFPNLELHEVVPKITLADPNYTFVTPASGDTVDFQYSTFLPVKFVVSDYISKRVYNVTVRSYDPRGIENVYEAGMWVNIFDIYGRKIATTNEDIYSMELPRGVYLVVMENGETIKLMR